MNTANPTLPIRRDTCGDIVNVDRWPDTSGNHLNAHGAGVMIHGGVYYLFGEHKIAGREGNLAHVGVHCYSSTDLVRWTDLGIALAVSDDPASDITRKCVIERPKVIYNALTRRFVMWFHLELKGQGYLAARTAVAVAEAPAGPYTFLSSFRPTPGIPPVVGADDPPTELWQRDLQGGQMSRDMTLFVDDDGTAYHIAAAEENQTLHIRELSSDYTACSGRWARALPGASNEAPAVVKHAGRYWMISSGCTGWAPNPARSAVADHPFGPWTELGNPAVGCNEVLGFDESKTFGAQSTCIIPLQDRPGACVAMFDVWRPDDQEDSRYIMLPMCFDEDRFTVPWMHRWNFTFFDHPSLRLHSSLPR